MEGQFCFFDRPTDTRSIKARVGILEDSCIRHKPMFGTFDSSTHRGIALASSRQTTFEQCFDAQINTRYRMISTDGDSGGDRSF